MFVVLVMISVCGVGCDDQCGVGYDQCSSVLVFAMMIRAYGVGYDQCGVGYDDDPCLWRWLL